MKFERSILLFIGVAAVGGYALESGALSAMWQNRSGQAVATRQLTADGETEPVGTSDDAADDPAIWRNPARPEQSLIVATDKRAGLYVYGLDGQQKSFLPGGELNNVDIREIQVAGQPMILVGASARNDRDRAQINLYRLDSATAILHLIGVYPAGPGEAYGFCLGQVEDGSLFAYLITKKGLVRELAVTLPGGGSASAARATEAMGRNFSIAVARQYQLRSQAEGCVVDDRTQRLYVGEENEAIWSFDLNRRKFEPSQFAAVNGRNLVADVEGLAIAAGDENSDYLVASSQGDNSYAIYNLATGDYVDRFKLVDGPAEDMVDGVSETDGIEINTGDFGPSFPHGLMVVQDGDNHGQSQNFKLLSWQKVLDAIAAKE